MKKLIFVSIAFGVLSLTACGGPKADEAESGRENLQKTAFSGPWETELLNFTQDQCAFRLDLQNDSDFTVQNFTMYCAKSGEYGLYAPLRMVKADVSQFSAQDLVGFTPPDGAKVLAVQNRSKLEPRGWIHEGDRKFYFAVGLTDTELWNRLSLTGQMEADGRLALTDIKMREGFVVQDKIQFNLRANPSSLMANRSAWNNLKVPSDAVLATDPSNRKYLYCVDAKKPGSLGLIDFVTPKYELDAHHFIGEMGFIDLNGANQVYMSRTDSGTVTTSNGFQAYYLSVTQPGGRTSSVSISIQDQGYAILTWNWSTRSLCRFLQNDIFKGRYAGWNP